jgi:hypothetical protein
MRVVQLIFLLVMLIGIPVVCVWAIVDHVKHGKNRPRRGSGGGGGGVGGALMELDRLTARPSVEHVVEARSLVLRREDDEGDGKDPPKSPLAPQVSHPEVGRRVLPDLS